jgi:hypothetical protein
MEFPFPHKSWAKDEWDQIKNPSKKEIIGLLNKDDRWQFVGVIMNSIPTGGQIVPWLK